MTNTDLDTVEQNEATLLSFILRTTLAFVQSSANR